uniref:Nuclear pore glycoprotein p62 n=1 Tax=Nothobranchius rachovii TaxID=451742 RepID=A0A1A8QR40_9TELE
MSGGFNFGQNAGLAFGAQKTTAAAPNAGFTLTSSAAPGGGFAFGNANQTNPTTSFSFGTPAKSSAGGTGLSFSTPTASFALATPQTTPAATGLSLGSAATPAAGSGFTLGSLLTAQPPAAAPAVATVAPSGGGFTFGAPTQVQPQSAVAPTATTAASGMSFGAFSFGAPKVQVTSAAAPTAATGAGFSFGTPATTASAAPTTQGGGFNFGIKPSSTPAPTATTQVAPAPGPTLFATPITTTAATTAAAPGFMFGAAPISAPLSSVSTATTTAAGGGLSFPLKPLSSATTTSAPASILTAAATTGTATGFILGLKTTSTTSTTTTATTIGTTTTTAPPVMTYAQLESLINKWSLELEDQERHFLQQATQVNAWDRMLVENGEKITSLHKELEKVKLDQRRLNQELDFILSQQKELEDLLCPLEESVKEQSGTIYMQNADEERERTYKLAENIDAQLKRMSQDLKEIIEHLNTSSGPADTSDPLQQICKILNAHMDSLQWIDQNSVLLQRRVEEVSKLCDTQRKEQEKSFRLTFD